MRNAEKFCQLVAITIVSFVAGNRIDRLDKASTLVLTFIGLVAIVGTVILAVNASKYDD